MTGNLRAKFAQIIILAKTPELLILMTGRKIFVAFWVQPLSKMNDDEGDVYAATTTTTSATDSSILDTPHTHSQSRLVEPETSSYEEQEQIVTVR